MLALLIVVPTLILVSIEFMIQLFHSESYYYSFSFVIDRSYVGELELARSGVGSVSYKSFCGSVGGRRLFVGP